MDQIGQRRIAAVVTAASLVLVGVILGVGSAQPAASAANGPTIAVGAPTLIGGTVQVPVRGTGAGFSPYDGFSLHVRWDPTVFRFAGADQSGSAFDPASGAAICAGPNASTYDGDGGGFILSCSLLGSSVHDDALLTTFALSVSGSGCSPIHPVTFGPPNGGDSTTASYTIDAADGTPQGNQYVDGAAAVDGTLCQPGTTQVNPALTPAPVPSGQVEDNTTPTPFVAKTAPPNASPAAGTTTAVPTPIAATPGQDQTALSTSLPGDQTPAAGSSTPPTGGQTAGPTSVSQGRTAAAASVTPARSPLGSATTPTSTAAASDKKSGSSNSTPWIIAGIVVAVVAVAGGGGYWYVRRSRAG